MSKYQPVLPSHSFLEENCCLVANVWLGLCVIWRHVRRVLMWRLVNVKLTNYESKLMARDELQISPSQQQRYEAWRRSLFMIALPSVAFSTFFSLLDILNQDKSFLQEFSAFGRFMYVTSASSNFLFCLSTFAAWFTWNRYKKSARFLAIGWLGSLVLSTWFLVFPVDFLYRKDILDKLIEENEHGQELISFECFRMGIVYSMHALPFLLTTPMGMIKGGLRIKGLLPEMNLAGWFIVSISPFFSLVVLTSTIMLAQLGGDSLFLTGIGFITMAPIICVFRRKLYTAPLTERLDCNLGWTQFSIGMMTNFGFVLLIIWVIKKEMLPNLVSILEFIFELIGRSLVTNVFFSDILYKMTICHMLCNRRVKAEMDWTDLEELTDHYILDYPENQIASQDLLKEGSMTHLDDTNAPASVLPDQERPSYETCN